MKRPLEKARGSTLVISLMLLVVLTLLAISAIDTGNLYLRIVGNVESQQLAEAAGDNAIGEILSSVDPFTGDPAIETVLPGIAGGSSVKVCPRLCLHAVTAPGYSATMTSPAAPQETLWEVRALSTDPVTGAESIIVQGVRIRLAAGNCAPLPAATADCPL